MVNNLELAQELKYFIENYYPKNWKEPIGKVISVPYFNENNIIAFKANDFSIIKYTVIIEAIKLFLKGKQNE